ncbi:MAG: TonB-dependent receptor [Prevotella sp.]|nr:TonB-dependent receptor [Prevotella sp.]
MKRLLLTSVVCVMAVMAFAQRTVTGKIVEQDTREPVIQATASLLSGEKVVANGVSNANGAFSVTAPSDGSYTLKITYVGFKTYSKKITIKDGKGVQAGTISLAPDAIMLEGATVTAQASKVTVKEDTFVYNASAYRTPEGSVVEELVKRLPGAEVSDDGTIKINGKEVKKILVDGKEFMTGDTKTAMQNLPTNIIEQIRAYDQKSDLARVSGIEDGEEETVLDFGIKRGMNKGIMANVDLAAGTHDRYSGRGMGAVMQDDVRVMAFARANNVNDMGFPGGGGGGRWGGQRQGLNAAKMLGVNVNYEKKDKLKMDGSVRWNHSDGDQLSKRSSEQIFNETTSSFSNSIGTNLSRSNSWNGQMRVEWQPDSMTNILFRPTIRFNSNDGLGISEEATFDSDPYLSVTNPLNELDQLISLGIVKNSRLQNSVSYSDSKNVGGRLQLNRKLSSTGRNLTLQLNANWSDGDSKSISDSYINYYQLLMDSTMVTNRYSLTPTKNWDYSARLTYSEPIMRQVYLQFSYQYQYRYSKSDRATYDFSNAYHLAYNPMGAWVPAYRSWDSYLEPYHPLDNYLDSDLSRFSEYKNYIHTAEVMLRVVRKDYTLNAGVRLVPQKSHFVQDYQGVHADTTRTVTNITPTLEFRWKRSNVSQLRFNYNGSTSQPSMSDLLDITDNSDPLNIKMGNPGLKPSFTQRFNLMFNDYIQKYQRSVATFVGFTTTSNSIANKTTYDAATGARTTRPENVNGNWNGWAGVMFSTAIDSAGFFNVNTFTNVNYNHMVGYVSVDMNADSQKSATNSASLNERLALSYRNSWLEVELNGSVGYTRSRNDLQPNNNLDTWQFSYGGMVGVTAPWGTSITTNMNMQSRRGYNDASMNTNELIWNAQLSQSFLKTKALTISLQLYDILHQQSSFSRAISSTGRTDTEYNSITSYGMLHVIYRLNLFGGKNSGGAPEGGPGGPGGFGGRTRGGGGGRPGGGFGGPRRF